MMESTRSLEHAIYDRRVCPLFIKVIKMKDKTYFSIVLHLQGKLLPDGQKIIDKNAKEWSKRATVNSEQ